MDEVVNRIVPDNQSILAANELPRKRILECYCSLVFGGLPRHMVTEVNGLQARGHEVYLALKENRGELRSEVSTRVPVFGLGYRGPYSYARMLRNLIRVIGQIRPQVIVSHAWSVDALVILATRFYRPRPRIVLFHHTLVEYADLEGSKQERWRARLLKISACYSYRYADAIVAVSPASKDGIVAHLGVPAGHISVIPSLWDMEKTASNAGESLDDPWFKDGYDRVPLVLGCGALLPAKDFPTLLRAFALVHKNRIARLVIVGDGPMKPKIIRLAEELGISKDFRILGYQPNPTKYMAHASVFVLSSVVEGFANVLVEALLVGVPVVATNVGGATYALDGGRFGLLVPPKDERRMAEAILTVLNDSSLRAKLSEMGPERARKFSTGRLLDRIERILLGQKIQEESKDIE
jgi:glycosyltransferase involved in cell wall biosynthesis